MPGVVWFALKIACLLFVFSWTKGTLPRYRYDQLMRLGWKVFLPLSLAMALTIRIGQLYGEKNWDTLRLVRRLGLWTGTALACCSMLLIFFTRDWMAGAYTPDTQVQQLAIQLLIFALAYQIFDSWQVTSAGILRGLQDTAIPMWLTLFCYWIVALPLGIVLDRKSVV